MGGRTEVRTMKMVDFTLQFALDTSILTALFSKGIPQGRRRVDREGAV